MRQAAACSVFVPLSLSRGASAELFRYVQVEGSCSVISMQQATGAGAPHPNSPHATGVPLPWALGISLHRLLLVQLESSYLVQMGTECEQFSSHRERRFPRDAGGILDFIDPSHDPPWLQITELRERRSDPCFSSSWFPSSLWLRL